MGREVRKVPPNWDHPNDAFGRPQPMYRWRFEEMAQDWKEGYAAWERGERPSHCDGADRELEYWEWYGSPPDRQYYRPWNDEDATWFQVWETVSEGTPITPPFKTQSELVEYLVNSGDFWQQKRWAQGDRFMQPEPPGYSREAAEAFVFGSGWVPTMAIKVAGDGDRRVFSGIDIAAMDQDEHQ